MPKLTGPAAEHPCFSPEAHSRFGRIHLPVAPRCNLRCAYCDRRYDCPNESRPGVASALLSPEEAAERVAAVLAREPRLRVAGVAGPGEPLANPETFELFRLLRQRFPQLTLCVSTNGLLLPDKLEELLACGVDTLTVTINAVHPEAASRLYAEIHPDSGPLSKEAGVALLLERQRLGLAQAVRAGLTVKVYTVLVPGINEAEVPHIAALARQAGAAIMNLTPLIPCGLLSSAAPPTPGQLSAARQIARAFLPQFTHCKQCRADACGIPGLGELDCASVSGSCSNSFKP